MLGNRKELVSPLSESLPQAAPYAPEWLTRHRSVAYAALALIPFLTTLPLWICHLSIDPIWFFSGIVQGVKPGIVPNGLPFGDPNIGWTTQALGRLAASQWAHGQVPWWNPYSGIGLPLAGEMQPGAFFLPFIFLLLLRNGWLWLRIAMQLVAGFSTFALCRELKLGPLASLVAGILFQLNGTFAFTPGPASVFCAAAFLPLLLLGIEQISKPEKQRTGTLWFALAIGFSTLAGFPEVAYIDGLLALAWALGRFALLQNRWRFASRILYSGLLGLALASPQLASFSALVSRSSAFQSHQFGLLSLPPVGIASIFVPYIYGPFPASSGTFGRLNVWGVSNYAGLLLLFFAFIGIQSKRPRWQRLLLSIWVLIAWAKTFGFKPVVAALNHLPFFKQTAFYLFSSPSWILCLIVLAAFGLDQLPLKKPRLMLPVLLTGILAAFSIYIAWPWRPFWSLQPSEITMEAKFLALAAGWALLAWICVLLCARHCRHTSRLLIAAIFSLNAAVYYTFPMLSGKHPGSVDRPAIYFLKRHLELYRFYTVGPIQPNYSSYFQLSSLNYDSFPVPSNFANEVKTTLFPPVSRTMDAIFWPRGGWYEAGSGLHYVIQFLAEYERLGVRYLVTEPDVETLARTIPIPVSPHGNQPLLLWPSQQTRFYISMPDDKMHRHIALAQLGILLGNYGNTADGTLRIHVCAGQTCAEGSGPLSASSDNRFFFVPLYPQITLSPGTPIAVSIRHDGGTRAVALWIWPDLPGQNQHLLGPDQKEIAGMSAAVSLGDDSGIPLPEKVYRDSVVSIFETVNPAPYFSIESGGPCQLRNLHRDSVEATCAAPARLVRRELYMPGWRAQLNRRWIEAKQDNGIFQAFDLPAGDHLLRFRFVPPFAFYAACAAILALLALALEIAAALRHRLRNSV
jgi:hypothetical protein